MMVGSTGIAAAIAHIAFWLLLARTWAARGPRTAALFFGLWVAGYVGLPLVDGSLFFMSYVAVLDIVLVLLIFRGDVQIFR
jgi:hypothetical protein